MTVFVLLLYSYIIAAENFPVSGFVLDSDEKPVSGAVVTLLAKDLSTISDVNGRFGKNSSIRNGYAPVNFSSPLVIKDNYLTFKSGAYRVPFAFSLYDVNGNVLSSSKFISAPFTSYNMMLFDGQQPSSGLFLLKLSIGNEVHAVKHFILNGTKFYRTFSSQLTVSNNPGKIGAEKNPIDTLLVSKEGYKDSKTPIWEYKSTQTVHLEKIVPSRIIAQYKVESDGYFYYNPPTLVDGYIYIGTSSKLSVGSLPLHNYFFKFDANINLVWKYDLGENEVRGASVIDSKGSVYFVVVEGRVLGENGYDQAESYLYKLDSEGQFKWKVNLATAGQVDYMGMVNPAIDENDIIYVGGNKLYAVDSEDGKFIWEYFEGEAKMIFTSAPVIDSDRNVYFIANNHKYSYQNKIYSLKDGTLNWECPLEDKITYSSPAFNVEGNELIVASNQTVHWIDLKNGNIKRKYTPEGITGELRGSPAVDRENNVYVGEKSNTSSAFFAIKADGTGLIWSKVIGADLYSSPALGDDGLIYTASEMTRDGDKGKGNRFHAMKKTTGATVWAFNLEMDVTWSSAAIDENGYIYIGDMKGYFYKIRSDCSGLDPHAAWPRFHGSNEGTGRKMSK